MKNITIILCLVLIVKGLFANENYHEIWSRTDLFQTGDYDPTRGVVWNPLTDHLLVVTRSNNIPRVMVLDPETGYQLAILDTAGLIKNTTEEGIGQIDIDDDGHIYVCNLGDALSGWNFKVWRYDDENSSPRLVFNDLINSGVSSNDREWYGSSLDIIGSGDNTYLYTSGWENNQIAVLKMDSRGNFNINHFIQVPTKNSARHGIQVVEPLGNLWINGAGTTDPPIRLISDAGDVIAEVPQDTMIGGAASTVLTWNVGPFNLISSINTNAEDHTIVTVQYSEDELGTVEFDYFGGASDTVGTGNINATAVLRYDNTRNWMYVLDGAVSLSALDLNGLLNVSTPRDSGLLAIELDGKNKEYTHYDKIGEDNGRELYLTWSDEIVYVGVNGSTLYAPYQERGLYIAFDTDPSGSNGSPTLPDEASGIQSLPFNADVIIQMDSDDYADLSSNSVADKWTTGHVYKWNGSSWSSGEITGLDINYGAMCLIGDGTDSLITEIGVARTPVGIGTNVMAMRVKVYLAELSSSGTVLAAFPNNGETGAGVSFSSYYEFSDVGDGIYPAFDVAMVGAGTSVEPQMTKLKDYRLSQNYPNPFNPVTWIDFELPKAGEVRVIVYDINGREVSELTNGYRQTGLYHISFDGSALASGVYFYQMWIDQRNIMTRKMILLK